MLYWLSQIRCPNQVIFNNFCQDTEIAWVVPLFWGLFPPSMAVQQPKIASALRKAELLREAKATPTIRIKSSQGNERVLQLAINRVRLFGRVGWHGLPTLSFGSVPLSFLPPCSRGCTRIKVQTCFVSDAIPRNNFPGKVNSVSFSFSLGILEKFQCVGGGKQSSGCKQELILSPCLNGERNWTGFVGSLVHLRVWKHWDDSQFAD